MRKNILLNKYGFSIPVFSLIMLFLTAILLQSCFESHDIVIEPGSNDAIATRGISTNNKYFRVLPGSAEWESFTDTEEMWKVCQLDKSVLSSLTTEELMEACTIFPFAYDYLFMNDERDAVTYMLAHFNGISELIKRKDGFSVLMKTYENLGYQEKAWIVDGVYRTFPFTLGYLELLLADSTFLGKASDSQLNLLLQISKFRLQEKRLHQDYLGKQDLLRSYYLILTIASKINPTKFPENRKSIDDFLDRYTMSDCTIEEIEDIIANL